VALISKCRENNHEKQYIIKQYYINLIYQTSLNIDNLFNELARTIIAIALFLAS